jgi:hypothetical protein
VAVYAYHKISLWLNLQLFFMVLISMTQLVAFYPRKTNSNIVPLTWCLELTGLTKNRASKNRGGSIHSGGNIYFSCWILEDTWTWTINVWDARVLPQKTWWDLGFDRSGTSPGINTHTHTHTHIYHLKFN